MQESDHKPLLSSHDVRALFRLQGELRELGNDPDQWRAQLASGLAKLCGTRLASATELVVRVGAPTDATHCGHYVECLHERSEGLSAEQSATFQREVLDLPGESDPAFPAMLPLYGTSFTRARQQLASDRDWYGSSAANDCFRRYDCDDYIKSMEPIDLPGGTSLLCGITLYRGWRERPFGERERALVALLHEQLAADWREAHAEPRELRDMSPRLRQTCSLLMRGLSEKEVAAELDLSTHTVHQYVKELYRRMQVRSRGELHARLADRPRALVNLAFPARM
ncbi:MAG TPA: helix-turn-helix transcriptional regulator [Polyangiales bacterium]